MNITLSPLTTDYVSCPGPQAQHDDTSPGAIASTQLEAVRRELSSVRRSWSGRRLEPTDEQLIDCLSHATDLPRWNVQRKLEELGAIEPVTKEAASPRGGPDRLKLVLDYLKSCGNKYATTPQISQATGLKPLAVRSIVVWDREYFERITIDYGSSVKSHRFAYRLSAVGKKKT